MKKIILVITFLFNLHIILLSSAQIHYTNVLYSIWVTELKYYKYFKLNVWKQYNFKSF